jgi:hypothetical protein
MDDVFIYHAHTLFLLSLVCVGTRKTMSTSIEHELTKRALESIILNGHVLNDMLPYHAQTSFAWSLLCVGKRGYYWWMRSRNWFQLTTSTMRAHQQLCKVTSFYSRTHAINSKYWLLFECCFALLVTFVGLMEGEETLKSCQTNLRKNDHMANSKYKRLHLPPLHDDVESTSRTTFFEAGGDDTGLPSDTTTSCASTTSTLKSDIIEAWKRRKKKNHRKEAWKRRKKRRQLKLDQLKPDPHRLKPSPPAKVGLNTGYSRSARVYSVWAMKTSMSSISLVTRLPLARGCLYIWVTLPLPRIGMN